jgi:hypothetical protein
VRGNPHALFGKRPTEKDPNHGHLAGGRLHSERAGGGSSLPLLARGALAGWIGLPATFVSAGVLLLLGAISARWWPLHDADLTAREPASEDRTVLRRHDHQTPAVDRSRTAAAVDGRRAHRAPGSPGRVQPDPGRLRRESPAAGSHSPLVTTNADRAIIIANSDRSRPGHSARRAGPGRGAHRGPADPARARTAALTASGEKIMNLTPAAGGYGDLFARVLDPTHRPDPYPLPTRLREHPIAVQDDGTYVVSTYATITRLLHDPRISSDERKSARGAATLVASGRLAAPGERTRRSSDTDPREVASTSRGSSVGRGIPAASYTSASSRVGDREPRDSQTRRAPRRPPGGSARIDRSRQPPRT